MRKKMNLLGEIDDGGPLRLEGASWLSLRDRRGGYSSSRGKGLMAAEGEAKEIRFAAEWLAKLCRKLGRCLTGKTRKLAEKAGEPSLKKVARRLKRLGQNAKHANACERLRNAHGASQAGDAFHTGLRA